MIRNEILEEEAALVREQLGERIETITVERAVLGLFFTGVKLSTGHGGLCFTPVKEMPEAVCCPSSARAMPLSGRLSERPVTAYLSDLFSDNILRKTLGIAALNALCSLCMDLSFPEGCEKKVPCNAFDEVDVRQYKKTVVIGALVPIMRELLNNDCDFKVLEQDIRTLKGKELEHYAPAEEAHLYVPDADLLVITGVTVLNDTLPDLLQMAKPGAEIIVTGPTASMLPEPFFKRGVTILGGITATDADRMLDLAAEGGSGYHMFGVCADQDCLIRRS